MNVIERLKPSLYTSKILGTKYKKYIVTAISILPNPAYYLYILRIPFIKMKVLIVEDNPKMREMLSEFIKPMCEEVFECTDGSEALSNYKQHHPDWVLMDWEMPEMDGITATQQIIEEFPNAQICMVSMFADETLRNDAFEVGVKDFVQKNNLSDLTRVFF